METEPAVEEKSTIQKEPARGVDGAESCQTGRGGLVVEVLNCIRRGMPTADLLRDVVNLLAECTGFEAVGLRLKEGNDYPYFQTRGLSEEFILLENSLCPRRRKDLANPDDTGDIALECA